MLVIAILILFAVVLLIGYHKRVGSAEICGHCYKSGWGVMLKDECRCKAL